ncbi:MAG: hypothetical protein LBF09_01555 [Odoribacteraceae bacterium]|jgi:C-terminal processing protease CtpA/Prc|nr:hypothetical protein [Odoribacteraceae bacterium]
MRLIPFIAILLLHGCTGNGANGDATGNGNGKEAVTREGKFNAFLEKEMCDIYFWADDARAKAVGVPLDTGSQEFLDALRHADDPWSRLDGEAFEGELASVDDGSDTGFGWIVTVWTIQVGAFARVEVKINHVYPGSPADDAGIQRGDFITGIDGSALSDGNINALFNTRTPVTVQSRKKNGTTATVTLAPRTHAITPVAKEAVIERDGKKVGYMFYTSFVYKGEESLRELDAAFTRFKQAGVSEFILDLRYNGGGYLSAARRVASLLAPAANVDRQDVLIHKIWNDEYRQQFAASAVERLDATAPAGARLGLSRLWVLTSSNTASASEIVISGLDPYMDVYTIGDKTTGKNAGGSIFTYPDDESMGAYLITMQYTNKDGESVAGGISPTHGYSANAYYADTSALGNPRETFVAIALDKITGTRSSAAPASARDTVTSRDADRRAARLILDNER